MAEQKAASRNGGMQIDSALVREMAELLNSTGLTEIEVADGDRKIRVARGGTMIAAAPAYAPAPMAPAAAAAPAEAAAPAPDSANALKSPMVGTV